METKTKQLAICIALPLAVGALSSFLTKDDMIAFRAAEKPALYPPEFIFPVVWTVLFLLMGIASYRIIRAHKKNDTAVYRVRIAIAYYILQLAVKTLHRIGSEKLLVFVNLCKTTTKHIGLRSLSLSCSSMSSYAPTIPFGLSTASQATTFCRTSSGSPSQDI